MTRFVQLHMLHSYGPSNLNRGDDGRPKSARVGGVNRLRISSQCLKRAWRKSDVFGEHVGNAIGIRTRKIGESIVAALIERGVEEKTAKDSAKKITSLWKSDRGGESAQADKSEAIFLFSKREFATALEVAERLARGEVEAVELGDFLTPEDQSIDIAMHGRMLANAPQYSAEAACQVSHAITTHRAETEDDYFSAYDDLADVSGDEGAGAGHIDVREFGAGVFYTYVCIDRDLLTENLAGRADLVDAAIEGLIRAATTVSPGGMQASFASRSPASYAMVEIGSQQPRSLAAAFTKPVHAADYLADSAKRLETFAGALAGAYGPSCDQSAVLDVTGDAPRGSLADLVSMAGAA